MAKSLKLQSGKNLQVARACAAPDDNVYAVCYPMFGRGSSLEADPTLINELDARKEKSFSTYYQTCINYFLTGDAYPDSSEIPLAGTNFIKKQQIMNWVL